MGLKHHMLVVTDRRPDDGFGSRRPRLGRAGFTMAEMMVVVAIIGIIAALGIPAYIKMLPHLRLKTAARDVASAMRLARSTAIAKNIKTRLVIAPGSDSFVIKLQSGGGWVDATSVSVSSDGWKDVDLYVDTVRDSVAPAAPSLDSNLVEFKPDGTTGISNDYEAAYLVSKTKAAERYRVRVARYTGMIYVEKWNNDTSRWEM